MNKNSSTPKVITRAIALTMIAAAGAGAATMANARVVDPVAETLNRLKQTSARSTADGYNLTSVKILGDITTDGLRFTLPSAVPDIPKVLMQGRVVNCGTRDITGRADVSESMENSESFSKSLTLGSTTTLEVSYESPVGISAGASQSLEISGTETEERTQTKTVSWNVGNDVPVGPRESIMWQFVVSSKEMKNIPWSVNAIVGGPVELGYTKPAGSVKVCLHEHANYGGKKKCFTTTSNLDIARFKDQKWDGDSKNINDEVTAVSIQGNAKVTLYEHTDFKGWNMELTGSNANVGKDRNDKFSAMKIVPIASAKTVRGDLNTLLTDQQRRIALSGTYNGVNGVMGEFRAGAPTVLTDADCRVSGASTATASSASAGATAGRSTSTNVVRANSNAGASIPLIQGRVLKSGIAPTSQQVVTKPKSKK